MDDNQTIFNSKQKLKETKQGLAKDFETGTDYNEKIRGFLGLGEEKGTKDRRMQLAKQMVYAKR